MASIPDAIEALARRYEFREPEEVRVFLAKNADLLDLLNEAATTIPAFLPPDGRIVLEVVRDPEEEGAGDELFAVVPTTAHPGVVRPMLEGLRRGWLIATPGRVSGRFNVAPEYR